ncbi:phage antirepressor KilAC domain-containing protein [Leptospira sp. 201903070]|uniref:Phage antirepressor KilAC domain-containing protein n=1 Tax=Leptospira ainlahdjerensis TaxID=2810033 RepID=A0ABS2UEY5_9LEPT|nr:phage antirepressor KilAC domain-containing protein [Leptospira ainlahdjerensis]MBM9578954.1 phage antirepressor KilAC domain-containing protein [Leptospira ainlahdjerensis]
MTPGQAVTFQTYRDAACADSRIISCALGIDHSKILNVLRSRPEFKNVWFEGERRKVSESNASNLEYCEMYAMLTIRQAYILAEQIPLSNRTFDAVNSFLEVLRLELEKQENINRKPEYNLESNFNPAFRTEIKPNNKEYERLLKSEGELTLQEASAILAIPKLGRNNLTRLLRERGIFGKNNIPGRYHVERGRFRIVQVPYETTLHGKPVNRYYKETVVTQKGIKFLLKELAQSNFETDDQSQNTQYLEADRAV